MTTITFKNGVMAADTLCVNLPGDIKSKAIKLKKISIKRKPVLIGIAGAMILHYCIDWIKAGCMLEKFPESLKGLDFYLLVAEQNKKPKYVYDKGIVTYIEEDFCAIGSGAPVALGAMWSGKSAVEAVRIASYIDLCTGSEIESISFEE